MVARIKAETDLDMMVIATGGLAPLFTEACGSIQHSDPDLTVRGLRMIHDANRVKTP